jgi:hypothetical protein
MMGLSSMFSEGVATRSNPHNLHPRFHVIVNDHNTWRTWCGYGTAREEAPGQYPLPIRLCPKCKALAKERLAEGDLGTSEVRHFAAALGVSEEGT